MDVPSTQQGEYIQWEEIQIWERVSEITGPVGVAKNLLAHIVKLLKYL